jgi:glycosyltransferase involved in cell wall biosynthesis
MRIGMVTEALPYLPSRGGFRLYGGNLIRHLSRQHEIHLVSLLRDDDEDHLAWAREYCASIETIPVRSTAKLLAPASLLAAHLWGRPLQHRRALAEILRRRSRDWDVVHVEGGYMGGIVPPALARRAVLSLHDSWTLRCQEMLRCAQSWHERAYYTVLTYHEPRYERLVYPRFARCIVVADRDLEAVGATVPAARVELIPYGTDSEYFHAVPVDKQKKDIVFHSHLGYAPNVEAALEFADEIFPLVRKEVPDATFHLVGAAPGPKIQALASRPGIRISADLPDLRAAVCSASIYACAIRHGTGLKSKVLEAMAMKMPIVCYPGSTVGISAVSGRHLLVAETPAQFARYVVDLMNDPARAQTMAEAGRALVEEHYSWESRARTYETLYGTIVEEARSPKATVTA